MAGSSPISKVAATMRKSIYKHRSDRREHAIRVLVAGLSGSKRQARMVELLSDPEGMWQQFSNLQQKFRAMKERRKAA